MSLPPWPEKASRSAVRKKVSAPLYQCSFGVDIGHRDRDRLSIGEDAVRGLDDHVIDVVGADVGGRLEIGRRQESQGAGRGIDGELVGVGSAHNRIGLVLAPASGSVAVTVVTAVVFSATDTLAVAPPPLEVIAGASFWLVTVTAIACVSVSVPSEAWTITS